MWIWRDEYDLLKRLVDHKEWQIDLLKTRLEVAEAMNLKLQDEIQTFKSQSAVRKEEDDPIGGDPLAEDESEIQRLIHEIRRDGVSAVIAREG